MNDKAELAKIYVKAQADGTEDSIAVLEPHLADDVLLTMALGPVDGKAAVLNQMKNPVTMYNFTVGRWQEPVLDGDTVKMTSSMPIEATLGGFNLTFNGTCAIASDESTRQKVYKQAIESAQRADAQMKGGAIVVDLSALEGVAPSGRVNMRAGGA